MIDMSLEALDRDYADQEGKTAEPKPNGEDRDPWPEIDPAAFHGLPGRITAAIAPNTEADPVAVLAHVLAFFGNASGRSAHYLVEGVWHTTNLFMVLAGVTARSRKGTAAARAGEAYAIADPEWHSGRVISGMSTGEGLIWAVRDPIEQEILDKKTKKTERIVTDHGVTDKRLCVLESEFGRVLQVIQRQGNTLSAVLRQAWETGRLMTLTRTSAASATGALITVIAHITQDELLRHLDSTEIANGLVNRFIFLAVRRSGRLPHGGGPVDVRGLGAELALSLEYAASARRITMDDAAHDLWEAVYDELTDDVPGLLGAITARAAPQVIRLALIYALADRRSQIEEPHLSSALALWRYSEASVRRIFGDALGDPIADTILAALRHRKPDGMSRTEIRALFSGNVESSRISTALDKLMTTGKATQHIITGQPGRPTEMWVAT